MQIREAVSGRLVLRLVDATLPAGTHRAVWSGRDARDRPLASGVYVVRLRAGGAQTSRRVALVR